MARNAAHNRVGARFTGSSECLGLGRAWLRFHFPEDLVFIILVERLCDRCALFENDPLVLIRTFVVAA